MSFFRDLRYAARTLLKNPALMIVATIALGLGIGATATVWSIVYGIMLKGLPYEEPQQIVIVSRSNPSKAIERAMVTAHDFVDYKAQQRTFEKLGASSCGTMNVSGTDRAERYSGCWISNDALTIPRVNPIRGRLFTPAEDAPGGERVVIIGHAMWQNRFAGADSIVGKTIRINGFEHMVVGIMPEKFLWPQTSAMWIPLQLNPLATTRAESPAYMVLGRMRAGISVDDANADLNTIAKRLETEHKPTNEGMQAVVQPFIRYWTGKEGPTLLYTMLGAVVFVLLIACANVANLLLDRAAHRTKEIGIRTALGASRMAIVRQFHAEALTLSIAGALVGTGLAWWGVDAFNTVLFASVQAPFFLDIQLHPAVLAFIVAITIVASLVSGALPAIQSSRADINEILKDESRGASSLRIGKMSKGIVVFEIALSCGLLVAAGLMTKSVTKLRNIEPGFETDRVFTARLGFPAGSTTDTAQQRVFWDQLPGRLAQIPGAQSASLSSQLPGVGMAESRIIPEGKTYERVKDRPRAFTLSVSPDFFKTFMIPVRQGRAFTDADRADASPVAIVTQKFADTHFPGVDPVGRRFQVAGRDSLAWRTIVGVVPAVFTGDTNEPWVAAYFLPFAQQPANLASIAVKTSGPPTAMTQQVRDAIASLNPDLPIYFVYTMEEALHRATWFVRVFGGMFMIFGGIALFLAAIGLYAVMAFSVSRRTREVGIRMALGASGGDVIRLILRQGMVQLVIGLVIGLAFAAGVSKLLSLIMFDVQPRDPVIFGGVIAVLAATGILACLLPASRATGVSPLVALRD